MASEGQSEAPWLADLPGMMSFMLKLFILPVEDMENDPVFDDPVGCLIRCG
jgi:hypothetical protein